MPHKPKLNPKSLKMAAASQRSKRDLGSVTSSQKNLYISPVKINVMNTKSSGINA
jgi:hypothetical protein